MTPREDRELKITIENILSKLLPDILRNYNNSIRDGIIRQVDSLSKTATVEVVGTNNNLRGISYISNTTPVAGNRCLLLSSDPMLKNRVYAIVFS